MEEAEAAQGIPAGTEEESLAITEEEKPDGNDIVGKDEAIEKEEGKTTEEETADKADDGAGEQQ